MIVVKIEMWPRGSRERAREIGRMYIYNDGGTDDRGDYEVRVCRRGRLERTPDQIVAGEGFTRTARIEGYPRLALNVWRLIVRALMASFPEER